jgi:uncharacterized protein YndB with AHSA1/START domain
MPDPQTVTVTRTIHSPPAEVCRGFTHKTLLRDWLSQESSSDPQKGGHLFLQFPNGRVVTGSYEQINVPNGMRFSWSDSELPAPSVVEIRCEPAGESTRLTLKHSPRDRTAGLGEAVQGLRAFWEEALENLASMLEKGVDLRLARRPRLGIFMDEFTPEVAKKLGVPVEEGVHVGATAEGSGARAAGLVKGDVLVSLNGVPLINPNSFEEALSGLKAGDRPQVEYYRGAEVHSTPLELSSFPILELPAGAKELAEQVKELNAKVMEAMRLQLEGLSDEQASTRPAVEEWSAKELVAHFVLCERDYQSWVADMLNDTPVEDALLARPNVPVRLDALIARLGNLEALLDELGLAKAESEALIAAFPESFVRDRKHLFRRAAEWELEWMPEHYFEEHREQFQAVALDAARGQTS